MDLVNESGEEIIITKNGKPVSRLVPFRQPIDTLFGLHKGKVKSNDSLISPIEDEWNAEQ